MGLRDMSDLLDTKKEKSDVWHECHRACDVPTGTKAVLLAAGTPVQPCSGRGTASDIEVVVLDKSEELNLRGGELNAVLRAGRAGRAPTGYSTNRALAQ
eukprot:5989955-Heterocapsa_arctica.AAC.1